MKANEEFIINQLDEAHQDVLAVLDTTQNVDLTEEEINEIVEHIAGRKDKIYFNYIDSCIRDIRRSKSMKKIIQDSLQEEIDKNE